MRRLAAVLLAATAPALAQDAAESRELIGLLGGRPPHMYPRPAAATASMGVGAAQGTSLMQTSHIEWAQCVQAR